MHLPDGLYDKLVTESLAHSLSQLADPSCRTLADVPPEEVPERVTEALMKQLALLLEELGGEGTEKNKRQIELINALLVHTRQQAGHAGAALDAMAEPPRILRAVHSRGNAPESPDIGLAMRYQTLMVGQPTVSYGSKRPLRRIAGAGNFDDGSTIRVSRSDGAIADVAAGDVSPRVDAVSRKTNSTHFDSLAGNLDGCHRSGNRWFDCGRSPVCFSFSGLVLAG